MNEAVFALFKQLEKENSKGLKSNYVFPAEAGRILKRRYVNAWSRAEEAGIKGLTKIHSLRHALQAIW